MLGRIPTAKPEGQDLAWAGVRRRRKKARRSSASNSGSSIAAKCPPRDISVQRWILKNRSAHSRGGGRFPPRVLSIVPRSSRDPRGRPPCHQQGSAESLLRKLPQPPKMTLALWSVLKMTLAPFGAVPAPRQERGRR